MIFSLQTETIDLAEQNTKADRSRRSFGRSNVDKSTHNLIDSDGLPFVGQVDDVYMCLRFYS